MSRRSRTYKDYNDKRRDLETLRSDLEIERSSFMTHWRQLSDFILPRRARFTLTDVNRGDRRNQNIISGIATLALRTLRSGMMAGVTSPSRPWFRLTIDDAELAESGAVKSWLQIVRDRMITTMLRSNLYQSLPQVYGDMGCFGTAAMYVQEDFENVFRCYTFPIGSYSVSLNDRLKVDTFVREYQLSVRQVVETYGMKDGDTYDEIDWANISTHVRDLWRNGNHNVWIDIVHIIRPNPNFDPQSPMAVHKRYASCTYERGTTGKTGANVHPQEPYKYLEETGYDFFPVLVPRWEVTGEDVYGTDCPGMTALGDIKALQMMHKKKAKAIDKKVDPPMVAPTSLQNSKVTMLPGDVNYVDEREGQRGLRSAHEVGLQIADLRVDIQEIERIIQRAFFEDLFLMLAQSDRREITAREIDERHEEKLLALGPVLEQLNEGLLDPLIEMVFYWMEKQGLIPEPPEELQGREFNVEYVSYMAQAQKLTHIHGTERFLQTVGVVAQMSPEVLHKIDADQLVDEIGELLSVNPSIIRTDEKVAEIRASIAKAQQAQAMAQMVEQGASAAKNLSQADMSGENALTKIIGGGAQAPE